MTAGWLPPTLSSPSHTSVPPTTLGTTPVWWKQVLMVQSAIEHVQLVLIMPVSGTYSIVNVTNDKYFCEGISAQGFMREPEPTTAMVGDMTVLYCDPPPSKPPPTLMWKKEGLYLNPSVDSRLTIMPSGNLYIINITEEDEGNYRCVAMNPVTGAKRRSEQIMLTVTGDVCVCVCVSS